VTDVADAPERERGAGDRDLPYRFHLHPSAYVTVREFARLLVFRARLGDRQPTDRPLTTPLLEAES